VGIEVCLAECRGVGHGDERTEENEPDFG
jgi:hypothetical protein